MKTRRLLGTVALLAAMLACDTGIGLPGEEVRIAYTIIATVSVTPSSGSGSFTMEVAYLVARGEDRADSIQCYYVSPEGNTMAIGDFIPERPDPPSNPSQGNNSLKFSVTQPGFYKAGCHTGENNSQETTTFTVTGNDTPTPESPSQPEATPTATLPAATLKGRIVFHYTSYQSSRASGGGEVDRVTKWCIPEVTVTPDGVVSGTCEFFGTADVHESTVTAHVTGIAVQGGSFNFTYAVTEKGSNGWNLKPGENPSVPVWSNEAKWEISYTGSGNFTSATQASGTATFNFSCDSGADNLFWCNSQTHESFSGTVLWSFVASP